MKILVIDDDDFIRTIISQALQSEGYDIKEYDNGEDAIEDLKQNTYDVVVTDVVMPRKSGASVGEYIKNNNLPTSVLAISAFGGDGSSLEFATYFSDDTLKKPFKKEDLLAAIKSLPVGGNLNSALQNM